MLVADLVVALGKNNWRVATYFVISRLQEHSAEARKAMDAGEMISDVLVADLLLEAILAKGERGEYGVLVDGFPRTAMQASGPTTFRVFC